MFPRLPARATFVADTNFVSGTQKMFLKCFFVQKNFVSATNVSQFAKPKKHHGQQCVRNNASTFTRALRQQCRNRPQKFTIDISSINPPRRLMEECWFLVPDSRLAISSALLNILFWNFPLHGPSNYVDRWRKLLLVRRRQSYPARPHRWLGRKYFSAQSAGRNSTTSGTGSVRISSPCSQALFSS